MVMLAKRSWNIILLAGKGLRVMHKEKWQFLFLFDCQNNNTGLRQPIQTIIIHVTFS